MLKYPNVCFSFLENDLDFPFSEYVSSQKEKENDALRSSMLLRQEPNGSWKDQYTLVAIPCPRLQSDGENFYLDFQGMCCL